MSISIIYYLVPFRSYRRSLFKISDTVFLSPLGGGLGATYIVHYRLIGKLVVDFLFVLTELFR